MESGALETSSRDQKNCPVLAGQSHGAFIEALGEGAKLQTGGKFAFGHRKGVLTLDGGALTYTIGAYGGPPLYNVPLSCIQSVEEVEQLQVGPLDLQGQASPENLMPGCAGAHVKNQGINRFEYRFTPFRRGCCGCCFPRRPPRGLLELHCQASDDPPMPQHRAVVLVDYASEWAEVIKSRKAATK